MMNYKKHFWEAIEETNLRFTLANLKDENFTIDGIGQARLSNRRWK